MIDTALTTKMKSRILKTSHVQKIYMDMEGDATKDTLNDLYRNSARSILYPIGCGKT